MKFRVTLHNGQSFEITTSGENIAEQLASDLNNRETAFLNLGGCIVQKNTVATILPIVESTENAQ